MVALPALRVARLLLGFVLSLASSFVLGVLGVLGALGALGALGGLGCDRSPPPAPDLVSGRGSGAGGERAATVRLSGSSALQPLVNAAKERFEALHSSISIEVSAGGSFKGLSDVASGAVHIGNSDMAAPLDLKDRLVDHRVAVVAFAAMANRGAYNERVTSLSLDDLQGIFSGAITDWRELGGDPQPMVVINRAPASGTRKVFGDLVLRGKDFVEGQTEDNSGSLVSKLLQSRGAISYLALSFADANLKVFSIRTGSVIVPPDPEHVVTGAYPLWSYEHMFTRGEPVGEVLGFLRYILSPAFQESVVPSVRGFIPITSMRVE